MWVYWLEQKFSEVKTWQEGIAKIGREQIFFINLFWPLDIPRSQGIMQKAWQRTPLGSFLKKVFVFLTDVHASHVSECIWMCVYMFLCHRSSRWTFGWLYDIGKDIGVIPPYKSKSRFKAHILSSLNCLFRFLWLVTQTFFGFNCSNANTFLQLLRANITLSSPPWVGNTEPVTHSPSPPSFPSSPPGAQLGGGL